MYVKICGLRDGSSAEHAVREGADAVGVVMSNGSPRNATSAEALAVLAAARATANALGRHVDTVLVVRGTPAHDAAVIAQKLGFDVLQLHDSYRREDFRAASVIHPRIWRATSLVSETRVLAGEFGEERLLLDSPLPGSGETWDTSLLDPSAVGAEWLLAGGLNPGNVSGAIRAARPGGVDVSSGVERSPGVKDLRLISEFIVAAKSA